MARTATGESFWFYSGPRLEKQEVRARDGKTWKKGQPMVLDSGLWEPVASNGTKIHGLAAENVDTSTSSSDVFVNKIMSTSTKLAGRLSYEDSDYQAKKSQIGLNRGVYVGSNLATVDYIDDTNAAVVIRDVGWDLEPLQNDSDDTPMWVTFTCKASALE